MEIETKKMQTEINNVLEMLYWLYQKELKSGNIAKEPIKSFGKICKKRDSKNNDVSRLFEYGK